MNSGPVSIIDPSADGRWDAFVSRAPGSSVFHHSSWKKVIEETFHLKPLYLALEDGADSLRCGIPFFLTDGLLTGKALISLPLSDYCDILTDDAEDFGRLWRSALDQGRENRARYVEIRLRDKGRIDLGLHSLEKRKTYLNHFLEIKDDIDFMEKKVIEKSYKYDIRQATKSGVVLKAAKSEPDMKRYYRLYVSTRAHHGLPPMPYAFFRNMWHILSPSKMIYLFLAYWLERPVAGIIFLRYNDCLYALSNSSDRRFLDKKPNHLLWWRGIQLAVDLNLSGLDFGRTSLDNRGLRFFKQRWGTKEIQINHYRYDISVTNRQGGLHALCYLERAMPRVIKRLPSWALRPIGNMVYRYL